MKRALLIIAMFAALLWLVTDAQAEARVGVRGYRSDPRATPLGVRGLQGKAGSGVSVTFQFGTNVRRNNGYSFHRVYTPPYRYDPFHHRAPYRPVRPIVRPPVVVIQPTPVYPAPVYPTLPPCGHIGPCQCTQTLQAGYWSYVQLRDPDGYYRYHWVWVPNPARY